MMIVVMVAQELTHKAYPGRWWKKTCSVDLFKWDSQDGPYVNSMP